MTLVTTSFRQARTPRPRRLTACKINMLVLADNCTIVCPPGQVLENGTCVDNPNKPSGGINPCPPPSTCCQGNVTYPGWPAVGPNNCPAVDFTGPTPPVCTNITEDNENCGACGNSCGTQPDVACCNGACTGTQTDSNNCGACGEVCPPGTSCKQGVCTPIAPITPCFPPLTCCQGDITLPGWPAVGPNSCPAGNGTVCTNTTTDPNNCGACGTKCVAGTTCCSGACKNTTSDVNNCGACGKPCASGETCDAGTCKPVTPCYPPSECCTPSGRLPGWSGAAPSCPAVNGTVCTNTTTDNANCGACGNVCAANSTCCGGSCKPLGSDNANCGACGNVCPIGTTCCGGVCQSLTDDPANCGACGNKCPADTACVGGSCTPIGPCDPPFTCCQGNGNYST
jgi:hypothetical protein